MKIKNRLAATLSAAALCIGLQGCATYADTGDVAAAEAFVPSGDRPALWRVADEDTTIYLFGTVHALPDDVNWKTPRVVEAINSSDVLVTEIDMTPEAMAAIGPVVQQRAMLPAGQTLRGLMNDEQRAAYEASLTKLGVPPQAFDQLEPWFAAITLFQVMMQQKGVTGQNGVENVLEAFVPEGTERAALETVEFQFDIFDTLPIESQLTYLLATAENPDEALAMLDTMITLWSVGNVDDLAGVLQEGAKEDPVLMERLFYARNANWAEWIDNRLDQSGTLFMAVGAGHLAGEKSVQDYLSQRDIAVTRIQ